MPAASSIATVGAPFTSVAGVTTLDAVASATTGIDMATVTEAATCQPGVV